MTAVLTEASAAGGEVARTEALAQMAPSLLGAVHALARSVASGTAANVVLWSLANETLLSVLSEVPKLKVAILRCDTLSVYAQTCAAATLAVATSTNTSTNTTSNSNSNGAGGSRSSSAAPAARSGATPRVLPPRAGIQVVSNVCSALFRLVPSTPDNRALPLPEVLDALRRSQVLEHASRAVLLLTSSLPPIRGNGQFVDPDADKGVAEGVETDWVRLCNATAATCMALQSLLACTGLNTASKGLSLMVPSRHAAKMAEAGVVRQLLSGSCMQQFLLWTTLCVRLGDTAATASAAGGGWRARAAAVDAASAAIRHGLPAAAVRPIRLHALTAARSGAVTPDAAVGTHIARSCMSLLDTVVQSLALTARGHCQLSIAQPPAEGLCPMAIRAEAAAGSAAVDVSCVPAVVVYDLVHEMWPQLLGMDLDMDRPMAQRLDARIPLARLQAWLLMQLRPRQAAARLPGLWRHVLLPMLRSAVRKQDRVVGSAIPISPLAGDLLRLRVPARRRLLQQQQQQQQQPATGSACYSLRCAVDAGLLPALEDALRNLPAWLDPGPDAPSVVQQLTAVNCVLRYSGVWPALLAHAPPAEVASLVVTLTAVARWLRVRSVHVESVIQAGCADAQCDGEDGGAAHTLCVYLGALLEQVLDLRALAHAHQHQGQQQQQQQQHQHQQQQQQLKRDELGHQLHAAAATADAAAAATAAAAAAASPHAHLQLNVAAECVEAAPMQLAWIAEAGGGSGGGGGGSGASLPCAWVAGPRCTLLSSFALHQWLPVLALAATRCMVGRRFTTSDGLQLVCLVCRVARELLLGLVGAQQRAGEAAAAEAAVVGAAAEAAGTAAAEAAAAAEEEAEQELQSWQGCVDTLLQGTFVDDVAYMAYSSTAHSNPELQACALDVLEAVWLAKPILCVREAERWGFWRSNRKAALQGLQHAGAGVAATVLVYVATGSILAFPAAWAAAWIAAVAVVTEALEEAQPPSMPMLAAARRQGRLGLVALIEAAERQAGCDGAQFPAGLLRLARSSALARRERPRWLLSPRQVEQRLSGILAAGMPDSATAAGGGGCTTGGALRAAFCGNPACKSLGGPTALIVQGAGKVCGRCKAVRYCCGLCQLEHWQKGGHDKGCAGAPPQR
ncbi:hypothetical protein HYH02_001804 [Chlamydomonas schloesseri]|uniref:phytol kinase n=1 Tax=Chlamydomonas schloesseri TaxID=2026947 RepID=A0A835WVS7_9CHLO|nr:hypothetical protein HYH02_001804 [Chlamydomonas schloesseri]|eukprot:KAG2453586.1 hypothetical protein HYH02_001804 [Chlamydomonas schloesseri]